MTHINNLTDLFCDKLRRVYDTEERLTKALPKMSKAAQSPALKGAFEQHLQETQTHLERARQLFGLFAQSPDADTDAGIKGIIDAGEGVAHIDAEGPVRDAALIAAAQAAEHYEIAAYGTLRTWAQVLGKSEAVQLLDWTLDEEKTADRKLTEIASSLNFRAATAQPMK